MRKLLIVLCVIVVCLSLSLYFGMFHGSLSDSSEEFSRFGDYVGGNNRRDYGSIKCLFGFYNL